MQYEHVTEERVYKYGPGQEIANHEEAEKFVYMERNRVLTQISLAGLYKTVEKFTTTITKDEIILTIVIKYPKNLL